MKLTAGSLVPEDCTMIDALSCTLQRVLDLLVVQWAAAQGAPVACSTNGLTPDTF